MNAIKCLVNLGEGGIVERFVKIKNKEDEDILNAELDGILGYMPEFETTEGEVICGSDIIRKVVWMNIPKLENKKYGEIIIKIPPQKLEKYINKIKKIDIETYEIKIYKTHFIKRI